MGTAKTSAEGSLAGLNAQRAVCFSNVDASDGLGKTEKPDNSTLARLSEPTLASVVITDRLGTIQFVNSRFTATSGYTAVEAIGENARLLQSGRHSRQFYRDLWKTILAGKAWCGEIVNRRKDGTLYTEEMTITPAFDASGTVERFVAIKRHPATRRAHEVESFLASIVESSEDAIVGGSPEGTIVSWNRGAELMYGYRAEEVLGKPLLMLVPPERREMFARDVLGRLRLGQKASQYEGVCLRKDGARIDVSVSTCLVKDAAGQARFGAAIIRDISLRKKAERATSLLASIVESSQDAIFTSSLDGIILSWNKGAEGMYGYAEAEIVGRPISVLAGPGRLEEQAQVLSRILQRGGTSQLETVTVKADGGLLDVSLTVSPIRNSAGGIWGCSTIARDNGARKRAEALVARSEEKYRSLVANIPDVIWTADAVGRPIFVSPNCERMYGYTPEELCQTDCWFDRIHADDAARAREAFKSLFQAGQLYDVQYRIQRRDGQWIWLHARAMTSYEIDGKRYTDGIASDITERKRMEEALAHQATHDPLTGLPNRVLFEECCQRALAGARLNDEMFALLYLDLDRFKLINDTFGHSVGDSLLQQVAERLRGSVRESELLTRSGGDEFMILLNGVRDPRVAAEVAERILGALGAPFRVKSKEVFISASIGIALFPHDSRSLVGLQRSADAAMYAAKRQGKNRFQMFTGAMKVVAKRRLALESEIHHALERGELSLDFQPQFYLAPNGIAGVEALLRWNNRSFGSVPPGEFIPIAEENGIIVPIFRWVLLEACRNALMWRDAGSPPIRVAVNVSAIQFARGDLTSVVAGALGETGFDARHLELEITESAIMQDIDDSAGQLAKLQELGVSVSLDDFGTGYSSLSYLERLPINSLKIDQGFVRRMNGAENTRALVRAMVALAHGFGMKAVAEGVETEQQLDALRSMGCDLVQGFLVGRPASADVIQTLLTLRSLRSGAINRAGQTPCGPPTVITAA